MNEKKIGSLIKIIIAIIIAFTGWACKVTEPPSTEFNSLQITVNDIGVKEVYLTLQTKISSSNSTIVLQRNGKELLTFSTLSDTLIIDTTVAQGSIYKYKLVLHQNGRSISESSEVEITTLNPTSNNYNWQIIEFGEYDPAYFKDVAIVDENNIWAVGEVYLYNPDGTFDYQPYGAAHYDGKDWKLVKVPYRVETAPPWPGLIIAACSVENNLFLGTQGSLLKRSGGIWKELGYFVSGTVFTGQVSAVWAPDSQNVYCSGGGGSIYYCTENSWSKLNSGTNTDINDICGYKDPITGKYTAYLAVSPYGSVYDYSRNMKILKITEKTKVDSVSWEPHHFINTVWTHKGFPMYAGGDGLYTNKSGKWKEAPELNKFFVTKIRGTGLNDIYAVGTYGGFAHYNGVEWKLFDQLKLPSGLYSSIAVSKNKIVAVGNDNNRALILIGTRY